MATWKCPEKKCIGKLDGVDGTSTDCVLDGDDDDDDDDDDEVGWECMCLMKMWEMDVEDGCRRL